MHRMFEPVSMLFRQASLLKTLIPVTLLLAGCSTVSLDPRQSAITGNTAESLQLQNLRTMTGQQDRLYRVAAPLLVNNAPLCKNNARNLIGFTAKNKYSFSDEYIPTAQLLGFDERLQVLGVLSESGAARAGIKRGDVLLFVEGNPMPQGPNAERQAATVLAPLVSKRTSINLGLLRAGNNVAVTVPLTVACGFGIELGNTDNVNAYADGRRVLVTRGMMNFARSDTELAYVLARELAHNILNHPGQQRMTATIGGMIDNLIRVMPDMSALGGSGGVRAMPQEADVAADSLALYMLARAGYDIDQAANFWQRLANQYPASVLNGYSAIHPATAFRLSAIARTTADIKAKRAENRPLMP